MKILSYNIMSGGFNGYDHETKQPQRLELIKKSVKAINADVISLVDTFRWDQLYTNKQLCEMFKYRYAHCINLGDRRLKKLGHNNGITVLSNVEGTTFKTLNLGTRNAIQTSIPQGGAPIDLFSIYLDDLSEEVRLQQIHHLVKNLEPQKASIIMGDLNTLSPKDSVITKSVVDILLQENPKYEFIRNQLYDMMETKVIQQLFDLGFKDAANPPINTAPTKLTHISDKAFLRLDHCLYKNVPIKTFQVLTDTLYDQVSDHYPIVVEL